LGVTAGTAKFLLGIARNRTVRTAGLAEHEKSAQKPTIIIVNIRKPTWEDYQNVPNMYVWAGLYSLGIN